MGPRCMTFKLYEQYHTFCFPKPHGNARNARDFRAIRATNRRSLSRRQWEPPTGAVTTRMADGRPVRRDGGPCRPEPIRAGSGANRIGARGRAAPFPFGAPRSQLPGPPRRCRGNSEERRGEQLQGKRLAPPFGPGRPRPFSSQAGPPESGRGPLAMAWAGRRPRRLEPVAGRGGGGAVGGVEPALQCVNWWQKNRARADARASAAATRSPTNAARAGSAARRSRCCAVKDADWGEAPGPGGVPVTSQRATLPRDLVPVAACPQGYGDASSFALLSAALLSANQCRAKLPRAERGRQAELDKSPTMDACMS